MGFGPPPLDQQKIIDQLVAQGVPLDQATQIAAQMAGDINGVSQSPENKIINTALPVAGAAAAPAIIGSGAAAASGSGTDTSGGTASSGGSSIVQGLIDAAKGGVGAVTAFLQSHGSDLLQAAGIADSAYRETQANKYANQALSGAQSAYDAKAPLRALGIAGLSNAGQGNPFATRSGGALPVAGQGGLGANIVGASPTDVLNGQGQNATASTGGVSIPRNPAIPLAPAPPVRTPMPGPMRIAGT